MNQDPDAREIVALLVTALVITAMICAHLAPEIFGLGRPGAVVTQRGLQ